MVAEEPEEQLTASGNVIGLTNGPLKKKRYINENIEKELSKFKTEIEEKFHKSPLKAFSMPR